MPIYLLSPSTILVVWVTIKLKNMIDDKKIEEAAKSLRKDFDDDITQGFLVEFGFEAGAKWAINKFLKDLWHPADEEPNKGKFILMEMRNGDNYALYWVNDEYSWERICTMFTTTSWLYIDDLFPKKGGNHD